MFYYSINYSSLYSMAFSVLAHGVQVFFMCSVLLHNPPESVYIAAHPFFPSVSLAIYTRDIVFKSV